MKKIIVLLFITTLAACKQTAHEHQLRELNRSLEYSNGMIGEANQRTRENMEEKAHEMGTWNYGLMWMLPLKQIKSQSDSINRLIIDLKEIVLSQTDSLQNTSAAIIQQWDKKNGAAYTLLNKLMAFKDSIPALFSAIDFKNDSLDSEILKTDLAFLRKSVPLLKDYTYPLAAEAREQYIKKWLKANTIEASPLMAMVMLNKLENDLLTCAGTLSDYCNQHVGILDEKGMYTKFQAVAALSSNYIKTGQTVEVYAGIGAFNNACKPIITINGKVVPLDQDAVATYHFTPNGGPGNHTLSIKFEFTKVDGTRDSFTKICKYTIAK